MKNIFKIFICTLFVLTFGCSDDDKLPVDFDELNVTGQPFAIQVGSEGLSDINLLNPDGSNFSKTYQFDSPQDGQDVILLEVFVNATRLGAIIAEEELYLSISSDNFVNQTNEFPQITVDFVATDIFTLLGLTTSDLQGGDQVNFRLAMTNSEGTWSDVSANFDNQSADNTFTSNVICLSVPVVGDWQLDMIDLYGDGWNGGQITVNIDGTTTTYSATGTGSSATINIPEGTQIFTFTYSSGSWEGENLYTLTDPNGVVVLDEGVGDGSFANGPTTGELLNICPE